MGRRASRLTSGGRKARVASLGWSLKTAEPTPRALRHCTDNTPNGLDNTSNLWGDILHNTGTTWLGRIARGR
jgi:hypothetical protein